MIDVEVFFASGPYHPPMIDGSSEISLQAVFGKRSSVSLIKEEPTEYVGDGVYAVFSGYDIKLITERNGKEEFIYLDHSMMKLLVFWAKSWELL
jgi:hypothetical protein